MGKGKPIVHKGPKGEEVKMPKPKHVQVLRGLAIQLINSGLTETEMIDGETIHYAYNLTKSIWALGYNAESAIREMLKHGYLVRRTFNPDSESFYIFTSKQKGLDFRRQHEKAAA